MNSVPTCIFCRIVRDEVPAQKVYESDTVLAFMDVAPVAPIHILVIPKVHVATVSDAMASSHSQVIQDMLMSIPSIAKEAGVAESGYRLICNTGPDAHQTVPHLHFHIMGGRPMGWPPG